MDQLPRLGKRDLICLLLFTCNYVISVWRGFLFLWVLGMGYVILLWHSLSLPYNYLSIRSLIISYPKRTSVKRHPMHRIEHASLCIDKAYETNRDEDHLGMRSGCKRTQDQLQHVRHFLSWRFCHKNTAIQSQNMLLCL